MKSRSAWFANSKDMSVRVTHRREGADVAISQKADAIIRGLRALSDFEFEFNMALMNRHLKPQIETLFVMPHEQFSYTSSSLVKQVARYGGDISHFVPANVAAALAVAFPRGA